MVHGRYARILVVILGVVPVGARAESLESQFDRFLSWWPGTYDNGAQVGGGASAGQGANIPTRLIIKKVPVPAFGEHVYYAEWQALDEPDTVTRQRFYGFEIEEGREALRLNLHIFPPDEDFRARTRGALDDPSRVADLTPKDMVPLTGCDVYFTWTGAIFEGAMDKGACAFPAPGTETPIYSWSQMRLTDRSFDYLDGWFNLDGTIYQRMSDNWYVFNRR